MTCYEKVLRVYFQEIESIESKKCASFEKPFICGYFSLDKNRKYVPSASNLMYYYPRFEECEGRRLKLDLNHGINNAVRKPENLCEKLDHLLDFIVRHADKLRHPTNPEKMLKTDFVCYRGLLTQIMCSMYINEPWSVCATKWKGVIYLCAVDKKPSYVLPKEELDKFCSWGYKFEQYMLTDKIGVPPDTSKPVYESEEICFVFQSKLNSHRLLYGAELDGILSEKEIDESTVDWNKLEFIELKTSKKLFPIHPKDVVKTNKLVKWWAQSYLVNVREIHCGFRDRFGIVKDLSIFATKDLPRMSNNAWDWKNCLNFCNIFLNMIKDTIPEDTDDPHSVWKFEWLHEFQHFKVEELKGPSPYSFVPKWYTDAMQNKC